MPNDMSLHGEADEPPQRRLERSLVAGLEAPNEARRLLREGAGDLPDELIDRAELAVSELVTNAVIHGSAPGAPVTLTMGVAGSDLTLEVIDTGSAPPDRVQDSRRGGFGLAIVRQLADDLQFERVGRWRVLAVFSPRPPPTATAAGST